jgi:hydrogenase maturation factor
LTAVSHPAPDTVCGSTHCITCGDDGDPMTVLEVDDALGLAVCRGDDGAESAVEVALIDQAAPGDRLLVHAGTALVRLEPEEDGVGGFG